MSLDDLNFHHLRYFWRVATDGNLTRTARRLHVAQSALSAQIRQLEVHFGQPLFDRDGRRLVLTEAGTIALAYAERIFGEGAELVSTLERGRGADQVLRVGAVATLSRNFQRSFMQPMLEETGVQLRLEAGRLDELLDGLEAHTLDLVLSNQAPSRPDRGLRSRRLARQPVSIIASKPPPGFSFPEDLACYPMIVPGRTSEVRVEFDALCDRLGVTVRILAEVDDMATIRLLAADADALAIVPSVVVRDELRTGVVHELCVVPGIAENFYGITLARRFEHPLVQTLLARDEKDLLAMA
ncbi:MAG: LysR family transcriptional activator of nhaA [Polyangiales bacterium]|jgi:LysR family transcriptional activator of nhaA